MGQNEQSYNDGNDGIDEDNDGDDANGDDDDGNDGAYHLKVNIDYHPISPLPFCRNNPVISNYFYVFYNNNLSPTSASNIPITICTNFLIFDPSFCLPLCIYRLMCACSIFPISPSL